MKIKTLHLTIILLLIVFTGTALAADPAKQAIGGKQQHWVNIFPIGTEIHSFAVDSQDANALYASVERGKLKIGIFKSVDGGKLWTHLRDFEIKGRYVNERIDSSNLKIDPITSKFLYLGLSSAVNSGDGVNGMFLKSKNGGITWEDIGSGIITSGVYDIALHPKSSEIMYVASAGGLYKTLNGGKTWGKIGGKAYSVFLNPQSPEEVYASIRHGFVVGLFYSKDGGQSFDLVQFNKLGRFDVKMCGEAAHDRAFALMHPTDIKRMLASCNHGGGGQSISKSFDGGKTWNFIDWRRFVPEATNKDTSYMVHDVKDWQFHSNNIDVVYFTVKMAKGDSKLPDKIIKSSDGGKTWIPLPSPPQLNIKQIVALSDTIYATTDYGIYKTTDDGKTWEPRSFGLPTRMENKELMWVDTKTDSIYVGDNSSGFNEPRGYWISSDKGISWKWNSGPKLRYGWSGVNQIATTLDLTTYLLADPPGERGGIYKITSEGKMTQIKIDNVPKYLSVSPSNSQILYAVYGGKILKSEDGGFSWTQIDVQKWLQIEQGSINLLSVDPRSPDILYAVVEHKQYVSFIKTTDGGKTWMDVSRGLYESIGSAWSSSKWLNPKERPHIANLLLSSPTSVVIDPSNSNIVYIATSRGGVYRTDDGGKTWKSKSPVNYLKTLINTFDTYSAHQCKARKNCKVILDVALSGGIIRFAPQDTVIVYPKKVLDEVGLNFNNIAIAPSNPKTIYLATSRGVYRSSDRGDAWHLLNSGLLDASVKRVIASPSLVLAEGESGIYKLSE